MKGLIITGSRWAALSDAATFPAWHFYEQLKNSLKMSVWAEDIVEGAFPNIHNLREALPPAQNGIGAPLKVLFKPTIKSSGFAPNLLKECENADFILLFYRGGTPLTDLITRSWGHKTLLHPTDNLLLYYTRAKKIKYSIRVLLEQIHLAIRPSRGIVFVSEADRKLFARLFPWRASTSYTIPLGVDTNRFFPANSEEIAKRTSTKYLFTGDLSYYPNTKACHFIVEKLLPQLPSDISMVFGGRRPPDFLYNAAKSDQRIVVTGYVEDLSDVYRACDVLLAPIFHGAGMQNKLLEASAAGLPCITTSICSKAFIALPPNFLIADNVPQFLLHAITLAKRKDLRREMGIEGRNHVCKSYSWNERSSAILKIAIPSAFEI